MRLLQLNVQRDKHYARILPFLDRERFDVICPQEVMEPDLATLDRYGYEVFFVPRALREGVKEGIAILSSHAFVKTKAVQYAGTSVLQEGPLQGTADEKSVAQMYLVAFADITIGDDRFHIATTHFPWTEKGAVSDFQRASMPEMLRVLKAEGDLILCGDFNAPRPNEIWVALASHYRDNIPEIYTCSLDPELHRAPPDEREKMVDGIFTTPRYTVSSVERVCGISDHCAFIANASVVSV